MVVSTFVVRAVVAMIRTSAEKDAMEQIVAVMTPVVFLNVVAVMIVVHMKFNIKKEVFSCTNMELIM